MPDQAEDFYKRAIEANPKNANSLGNYAQMLLALGRKKDGFEKMKAATFLEADKEERDLTLELAFYWYAHGPASERGEWLARIKRMLQRGVRSAGWDLTRNVERAVKDRHPAKSWLGKLAAVVSDEAKITSLKNWELWRDAR